jgi:hypothetical protein
MAKVSPKLKVSSKLKVSPKVVVLQQKDPQVFGGLGALGADVLKRVEQEYNKDFVHAEGVASTDR